MEAKTMKAFRLSEEAIAILERLSKETKKSQTEIIENMILEMGKEGSGQAEEIAAEVLKLFNDAYQEKLDRMHTSMRLTDRNSQIALDLLNSSVSAIGAVKYLPADSQPTQILKESQAHLREKLSNARQKAAFNKV